MSSYFVGILEEERKENKQQADESAKQIKLLKGISVLCGVTCFPFVGWRGLCFLPSKVAEMYHSSKHRPAAAAPG